MASNCFLKGFVSGIAEGLNDPDSFYETRSSCSYHDLYEQLREAEELESYPPLYYRLPTEPSTIEAKPETLCQVCKLKFASHKGLMQHKSKTHDRIVKSVPCTICEKSFKHKYALKFHVNQVHQRGTRVQCNICLKVVYNKYALKAHVAKHAKG